MYPLQFLWREGVLLVTPLSFREKYPILIVFTGRQGGVSHAPYDSFNLAFGIGDDPAAVMANRQKLCSLLGLDPQALTSAEQTHSSLIGIVDLKHKGRGACNQKDSIPQVDGLVTKTKGIPLILFFADCVPIVLCHPQSGTVAILHAGWKGTLDNIASKAIDVFEDISGAKPESLFAFIGPAIGPCCYEVGQEVVSLFKEEVGTAGIFGNKLDLTRINFEQLQEKGIPTSSIEVARICTCCHSHSFFSYRASGGKTGRQAGLVVLL